MAVKSGRSDEPFETRLNDTAAMEDVDGSALEAYAQAVGAKPGRKLLAKRGFLVRGRLTNAGVLLFAAEPGRHLIRPETMVEVRTGIERGCGAAKRHVRDRAFDMPLVQGLPAMKAHVAELLRLNRRSANERGSCHPCYTWWEGLVNAIAHRDYELRGDPTSLSVLSGRIEVTSAGGPPGWVTLDTMRTSRYARNPSLVRALVELGWMHDLGVGVRGIYETMGEANVRFDELRRPEGLYTRLTLLSRKQ